MKPWNATAVALRVGMTTYCGRWARRGGEMGRYQGVNHRHPSQVDPRNQSRKSTQVPQNGASTVCFPVSELVCCVWSREDLYSLRSHLIKKSYPCATQALCVMYGQAWLLTIKMSAVMAQFRNSSVSPIKMHI